MKKLMSLTAAKGAIFVLFVVMLVVTILFGWSARVLSVVAVDPEAAQAVGGQDSDAMLRQIEIMQSRIDLLEGELSSVQSELTQAAEQNENLISQQAELVQEMSGDMSFDYMGNFYATAYCAERYPHICGGNGVTASGTVPTPGVTIAADWGVLPAGTWVYIDGVGVRRVEDKGSAITGNKIDICLATHAEATRWGNGYHDVWVINWDGLD